MCFCCLVCCQISGYIFLHVCCTPQFRAGATSLNKLITIVFVLAHRLVELQQVYFVLLPDTQSLGVIEHFCNVSLGVHVSQHAAGVHFPIHIPTTTSHRHHHHNVCSIRGNKNGGASTKQFRVSSRYWLGLSQLAHSLVLFASVFLCFATQVLQRSTTEEERGRGRNTKKAPQKEAGEPI